jgi:hypothetical protein
MANCSIPNSTPAIGRTSTLLSRRSRRQNSASASFFVPLRLTKTIRPATPSFFNAQRSTPNAQRSTQTVGCWTLGVRRWAFSFFRRVKGAWWPSRSSKPLSVPHTRNRGRFDSYPLRRLFNAQRSTSNTQRPIQTVQRWALGVRRWTFTFFLNHCGLTDCVDPQRFQFSKPQSTTSRSERG